MFVYVCVPLCVCVCVCVCVCDRLAKELGLRLVRNTRFDDFFREFSEKKEHRTLLNRMQALEVSGKMNTSFSIPHVDSNDCLHPLPW